jgi:hypothetical protein
MIGSLNKRFKLSLFTKFYSSFSHGFSKIFLEHFSINNQSLNKLPNSLLGVAFSNLEIELRKEKKHVTSISWNPSFKDLLTISLGS